ncbi:MAG: beta-N-acetylhexosaminidase, partial [Bacteroidales bacterium]|nr:beta-N-acetylhexosaminidase [Bacteroidales bacterium]
MRKYFTLLIIYITFGLSVQLQAQNSNDVNNYNKIFQYSPWVDSVYNSLSYEEKISQLFMVAAYSNKGEKHISEIKYLVEKYNIGGLIFFQGNPHAQAKLTNYYQSISKTPLLVGLDAEWGLAMRLDNTIKYPRQMTLGAIQNDSLIYQMGADIAEQLKRIGVQVNFAPVSDINNNPRNPVINSRSFGEDRENVAQKSIAYMKGMQDNFVLATAKHFPGHGDTDKDSHETLPTIKHSRQRLDSLELYPFKQMINSGVGGIMVAHLNVPALEKDNLPSTLSKNIVTNILKGELGFEGLAITDALNMKGITNDYNHGDIEAMALLAGNDILLFPQYVSRSISKIKHYVRRGYITKGQINESCKKILALKYWSGLNNVKTKSNIIGDTINLNNIDKDLNKIKYELSKRKLIEESITLVENKNKLIPLRRLDTLKIASLALGEKEINKFQNILRNYLSVDNYVAEGNTDFLLKKLSQYNLVILGIHNTNNSPYRNFGVKHQYIDFINKLSQKTKVIVDVFANPYSLQLFNDIDVDGLIMSYQDDDITQSFSAQLIFGGIAAKGELPVSIKPKYPIRTGIKTKIL